MKYLLQYNGAQSYSFAYLTPSNIKVDRYNRTRYNNKYIDGRDVTSGSFGSKIEFMNMYSANKTFHMEFIR